MKGKPPADDKSQLGLWCHWCKGARKVLVYRKVPAGNGVVGHSHVWEPCKGCSATGVPKGRFQ